MPLLSPPVALTIAGFDPSSGAGITADLKTFAAHGLYGVTCITATTVQSTMGVRSVHVQPAIQVQQTLDCLAEDISIAGLKIGMLGTGAVAGAVASFLMAGPGGFARSRVVLDPVIQASSGSPLIDPAGISVIREKLLAHVGWITPNVDELRILIGTEPQPVGPADALWMEAAASTLKAMAHRLGNDELNIIITGGHLHRPDDLLLAANGEQSWLSGERILTQATHGTGCAFSSALLCGLVAGQGPHAAAVSAKAYVTEALRSAYAVGKGKGPMNHLFPLHHV